MAITRTPKSPGSKTTGTGAPQLEHTLKELGSAFADWESLGNSSGSPDEAAAAPVDPKAKAAEQAANEFRKRTQALLDQLRDQLSDLTE